MGTERYTALRSMVIGWDMFLEGRGRFLLVMWDAPVALWEFFFPELDVDHQRPEVILLPLHMLFVGKYTSC